MSILNAERKSRNALIDVIPALSKLATAYHSTLEKGGRIALFGAGTSGRLALLDAAELPPTFGAHPDTVKAFIAGGIAALSHAQEGAEDDLIDGARVASEWGGKEGDLAIGIAASGSTPWTLSALETTKRNGCTTGCISTKQGALSRVVDHPVVIDTGEEWLRGSTRMAAASATRSVMVALSTAAFAHTGAVYQNRMVKVVGTNEKLRLRAQELVRTLGGTTSDEAIALLKSSGGEVDCALVIHHLGLSPQEARKRLACDGLSKLLGSSS